MDKLSKLFQEAKPLYKQRKRNKTIAKIVFSLCLPVFVLSGIYQVSSLGDEIYLSMQNSSFQEEITMDEFGLFETK